MNPNTSTSATAPTAPGLPGRRLALTAAIVASTAGLPAPGTAMRGHGDRRPVRDDRHGHAAQRHAEWCDHDDGEHLGVRPW